eukprot:gb/GECH01011756.1/.p1 GENE.gb/GECH01011756.1/~~gb/GECH01011756.1/.p1  ORF type:complete len:263 (+),score=72.05 gb/GECH01011756.1/:1-789(+)
METTVAREESSGILETICKYVLLGLAYLLFPILFIFYIRVLNEYERGVVFRLGRSKGAKGPGMLFLLPFVDSMERIDLRTVTLDVPAQEAITKDSVTVLVNAVIYFKVFRPTYAVCHVDNHSKATYLLAQTTLRSVLGTCELDELLTNREELGARMQEILDKETNPWGIKVSAVEIKDIQLPQTMQRAMASQAEAERERRAKVIAADGEFQSSSKLAEAAEVIGSEPAAMQLRYLQTLAQVSAERPSTMLFPLPVDIMSSFV